MGKKIRDKYESIKLLLRELQTYNRVFVPEYEQQL